jgi:hypothetical protein
MIETRMSFQAREPIWSGGVQVPVAGPKSFALARMAKSSPTPRNQDDSVLQGRSVTNPARVEAACESPNASSRIVQFSAGARVIPGGVVVHS